MKNLIKFSKNIKCRIQKFDEYKFNEENNCIEGIIYRYDMKYKKENDKTYRDSDGQEIRILKYTKEYAKDNLLSSLIKLKQDLPSFELIEYKFNPKNNCNYGKYQLEKDKLTRYLYELDKENIKHVEEQVLTKDKKKTIDKIINWCQKYGMPFIRDIDLDLNANNGEINYRNYGFINNYNYFLKQNESAYKFRLGIFLIGLDIIYDTFLSAISLEKYSYLYSSSLSVYEKDTIDKLDIIEYEKIDSDKRKQFINKAINSMKIYLESEYESNDEIKHDLYAETLFSATMYQLLLFIEYKDKKVDYCKACNKVFLKGRTDKSYCSDRCRQYAHRHLKNK